MAGRTLNFWAGVSINFEFTEDESNRHGSQEELLEFPDA
jgi:hypothetical protein